MKSQRVSDVGSTIYSGSFACERRHERKFKERHHSPYRGSPLAPGHRDSVGVVPRSNVSKKLGKSSYFLNMASESGCLRRSRPSLARPVRAQRVGERRPSDRGGNPRCLCRRVPERARDYVESTNRNPSIISVNAASIILIALSVGAARISSWRTMGVRIVDRCPRSSGGGRG